MNKKGNRSYYIGEITKLRSVRKAFHLIEYCNINELTEGLESFIEDKVVSIMKPLVSGGTQNTGEIKSISRGDTKIEYNVGDVVSTSNGATLTASDKEFLKQYRRARCY